MTLFFLTLAEHAGFSPPKDVFSPFSLWRPFSISRWITALIQELSKPLYSHKFPAQNCALKAQNAVNNRACISSQGFNSRLNLMFLNYFIFYKNNFIHKTQWQKRWQWWFCFVCVREKGSMEVQKNQESKRVCAWVYEGNWDISPSMKG